ncbi:MAG TPA: lamin tail domain-containing protein [bacterium]|nr:lamin tail domain-containing protein [bacterium]
MKHSGGGWIIIHSVFYVLMSASLLMSGSFVAQGDAIPPSWLLISKVQINGGVGKADNDFITIYNNTAQIIDLNGFRLVKRTSTGTSDTTIKAWSEQTLINPGDYHTWANSNNGFNISLRANSSSTQTLSNDNGIALRQGPENTGTIIDSLAYGDAVNSFIETAPFPLNPSANETLSRSNGLDSNNNSRDFKIFPSAPLIPVCGNTVIEGNEQCDDGNTISLDGCSSQCQIEIPVPICGNNIIEDGEQCDDGNTISNDSCSATCQTEIIEITGEVRINEFVADPISGQNEWIELSSNSTTSFSLTNWMIEDGAGSKTRLSGNIGGSEPFIIIEKPTGSLNNSGDIIILRNKIGTIIDQVTYGDWNDGNVSDNAPTIGDPCSIALLPEIGLNTNDSLEYAQTTTVTKGQTNIITPLAPEIEEENDVSQDIVISEIFPNPIGIDTEATEKEFIELYNTGNKPVDLSGWRIEIGDKEYIYEFPLSTIIESRNYFNVSGFRADANYNFKLDNEGTVIKLFQPEKQTPFQTVTYKKATEGQSWILVNENNLGANKIWKWTSTPTLMGTNISVLPPKVLFSYSGEMEVGKKIRFDSSDSDTGITPLTYTWNFGDQSTSTQANPEHTYKTTGTYDVSLTLKNSFGSETVTKKLKIVASSDTGVLGAMITSSEDIDSVSSTSSSDFNININEIFPNPTGKDDGQEWVEIINSGNKNLDLKNWHLGNKTKKGIALESIVIKPQALYTISGRFLPTLGNSEDTISLFNPLGTKIDTIIYGKAPENKSYSYVNGEWQWSEPSRNKPNISSNLKESNNSSFTEVTNNNFHGTVISLPGTFGAQYFYAKVIDSENLYQIYNSKKLFPILKIGQEISVTGELGTTETGPRFKTAVADDITIIGEGKITNVSTVSSLETKQPPYPRLINVEGEITSKKSPRLILTDQSGDIEIYLAKGSGLSITNFELGDKLSVTGILELSGTTPRVMPRNETDIKNLNPNSGPTSSATVETISRDISNHPRDNKKALFTYLGLSTLAIAGGGGYWLWKRKKNAQK